MIVYWDLVVLTNLIIDYAFLKTIAVVFKEEVRWYRLLISLLLGLGSLFLFLLPIKYLYNLRYVIGIFMGMIAYNYSNQLKRFQMIISFYIINLVFIGSLVIFEVHSIWLLLITMIYVIILTIVEKTLSKKIKEDVWVKIDNQKLKALIDTGNKCYYLNKPVIFLDERLLNNKYKYLGELEITTISSKQIIKVYIGPKLLINNQKQDVFYSFSKIDNYDVILHNSMGV